MTILGIESSCDETGAAIITAENNAKTVKLLSNIIASSITTHSKTGGIIPENAAREQIKYIIPVIKKSLEESNLKPSNIDAIAVTYGPGLIGSLLVGVETAKTLSYIWDKPLIPTNHLLGHIYANFISNDNDKDIKFPAIGLIVSGGHTDLILIRSHKEILWLGGTRDDAAGEAFDKIGRLLNLPYPGGPSIERMAKDGSHGKFKFPRPLINSKDYDFSFSGLKTAVLREVNKLEKLSDRTISDICIEAQDSIIDVLIEKTFKAVEEFGAESLLLGGGVSANSKLREEFENRIIKNNLNVNLFVPEKYLCTDNGAMIAAAAFFQNDIKAWQKIDANPGLYFDQT